jgi:WD40 repeat protein
LFLLQHHSRPVNCLSFNISDPSQLISTSYDGSVRLFDLNQQKSSVIFGFPEDETFSYTSYHSQLDTHTFLITLGRHGMVGLVDTRVSNRLKTVADFKIYDKASPKMVDIHPTKRY